MRSLALFQFVSAVSAFALRQIDVAQDLKNLLSSPSCVTVTLPARWSTYQAPHPAVVVDAQTENDIAAVVRILR